MRESGGTFFFVLALAAYSFIIGTPTPRSSKQNAETSSLGASVTPSQEKGNLDQLLDEYVGPNNLLPLNIEFLIATVPDPQDSHAGWLFDPFIDAIQRAAESTGYVMSNYRIPWKSFAELAAAQKQQEAKQGEDKKQSKREQQTKPGIVLFRDTHDSNNFLVVYLIGETPTSGIHANAFSSALKEIVNYRKKFPERYKNKYEFNVLGPAFSGSAASLQFAIRRLEFEGVIKGWRGGLRVIPEEPISFEFISGSATSVDKSNFEKDTSSLKITFHTTTVSDAILLSKFLQYLASKESSFDSRKLALLTEANTEFGRDVQDITLNSILKASYEDIYRRLSNSIKRKVKTEIGEVDAHLKKQRERQDITQVIRDERKLRDLKELESSLSDPELRDLALKGGVIDVNEFSKQLQQYVRSLRLVHRIKKRTMNQNPKDIDVAFQRRILPDDRQLKKEWDLFEELQGVRGFVQLPFPIHTAHVRTAYEKELNKKRENEEDSAFLGLDLSLREEGDPIDLIPSLTPSLTSRVSDKVISSILTSIAYEQVRYVGLFSTDTRDKLFLAQRLRDYCPNVRIFTTEADILFAHPDTTRYTKGMLVISTYPLVNLNQKWTRYLSPNSDDQRLQFPSSSAQGVYNATIALLDRIGRKGELLEYGPPDRRPEVFEKDLTIPPVWISVIGNGGIWPVEFLTHGDTQLFTLKETPKIRPKSDPLNLPVSYFLESLFFLVCFFSIIHCLGVWLKWRSFRICRIDAQNDEALEQSGYLLGTFLLLLVSTVALLRIALIAGDRELVFQTIAWTTVAVLMITNFKIIWDGFVRKSTPAVARRLGIILFVACFVLSGFVLYFLLTDFYFPSEQIHWLSVFFYLRVSNPLSGVSAISPILFLIAIIYLFLVLQLKRVYLLKTFRLKEELQSLDVLARGGLQNLKQRMNQFLKQSALSPLFFADLFKFLFLVFKRSRLRHQERLFRIYYHAPHKNVRSYLVFKSPQQSKRTSNQRRAFDRDALIKLANTRKQIEVLSARLKNLLGSGSRLGLWYFWPIVIVAVYFPGLHVYERFLPTIEGWGFDFTFLALLAFSYVFVLVAWMKFVVLSQYMKRILERFAAHPILEAYSRLPKRIQELGGRIYIQRPTLMQLAVPVEHSKYVYKYPQIDEHLLEDLAREDLDPSWSVGKTNVDLTEVFKKVIELKESYESAIRGREWNERAEEFLALRAVFVLRELFIHLRNYLMFATCGMLLMLFAVTSYPFQPRRLLMVIVFGLILVVVFSALTVLIQMNRDEVLSRISKTPSNEVSWTRSFAGRILVYVIFPLLTALAAQFPEVGGFLLSILQPLQSALP